MSYSATPSQTQSCLPLLAFFIQASPASLAMSMATAEWKSCFGTTPQLAGTLFCFDDGGNILWRFAPGRPIRSTRGFDYAPPYAIAAFTVYPAVGGDAPKVVVTSNHHFSYPCQVVVLNGNTGKMTGEYWHRGQLRHILIADLQGQGVPQIILGGVNDAEEYRCATVLIFDHLHLVGGSCGPNGKPYFEGLSKGQEEVEIFFPRTPLCQGKEFNIVRHLGLAGNRLNVEVAEDIAETLLETGYVMYEFDPDLSRVHVMLGNQFNEKYREYQAHKRDVYENLESLSQRLQREVKVRRRS